MPGINWLVDVGSIISTFHILRFHPEDQFFFFCGRSDRAWQSIVLWGIQMCLGILPARPLPGCICYLKTTLTNQSYSVFPLALTPPWHSSVSPCFRTLPIFSGFLEWYLSFVMVQVPPPPGGLLQSPRHWWELVFHLFLLTCILVKLNFKISHLSLQYV